MEATQKDNKSAIYREEQSHGVEREFASDGGHVEELDWTTWDATTNNRNIGGRYDETEFACNQSSRLRCTVAMARGRK